MKQPKILTKFNKSSNNKYDNRIATWIYKNDNMYDLSNR